MTRHKFDPIFEGCERCAALPGEGVACEPPTAYPELTAPTEANTMPREGRTP